ncbi:hypothetical protein [Kurthia sibirica]|uniref:Uncharacterized protein n=1 Tax=Kurthia sibirica TaxID=202750 RepID=A0A2U3AHB8_9BACL|nr:hypothetical protein [Kurthia sibirica]PWI23910.1 hypothetical protein DEX24_15385 [Kurthia sibirica]GEK34903.1 hypothetical protein KSI01_24360 [Kurthia sibirica]
MKKSVLKMASGALVGIGLFALILSGQSQIGQASSLDIQQGVPTKQQMQDSIENQKLRDLLKLQTLIPGKREPVVWANDLIKKLQEEQKNSLRNMR